MGLFSLAMPNSGGRLGRGHTKFDFIVDEEKGPQDPARDEEKRQAPQENEKK